MGTNVDVSSPPGIGCSFEAIMPQKENSYE